MAGRAKRSKAKPKATFQSKSKANSKSKAKSKAKAKSKSKSTVSARRLALIEPIEFMKFPAEVRNAVYDLLLVSPEPTTLEVRKGVGVTGWRAKGESQAFEFHLAIIRASKKIREEAQTIFLKHNRFVLGGTVGSLYEFLTRLKPANRRTITSLRFNYTFHWAGQESCFRTTSDVYRDQEAHANMAFRLLARCDNLKELGIVVNVGTLYGANAWKMMTPGPTGGFLLAMGCDVLQAALNTFDDNELEIHVYNIRRNVHKQCVLNFEQALKEKVGEREK